jgi:hypothetical protein
VGVKRYAYGVWWENLKERNNVEDLSIDRCIILQWILNNRMQGRRLDLSSSG